MKLLSKQQIEGHNRRVKILLLKGWQRLGTCWISPYTGHKYDETNAVNVEDLRGTFKQGYEKNWVFA